MLNLTDQECRDILCTILESASSYWMNDGYEIDSFGVAGQNSDYAGFTIYREGDNKEVEQPVRSVIGVGDIAMAAERIMAGGLTGSHIVSMIAAERAGCDIHGADCIAQVAVFGKLIYG